MAYPVRTVTAPAVLQGKQNGKFPDSALVNTPGQAGGVVVRLVEPAARAWKALCATALAAGHVLKAVGPADSYRPYSVQERIFLQRYTTERLANRPTKKWNGQVWYQKPGTAIAAVPGTSNHGFGLAVDTGEERDSDAAAESLDQPTLAWLIANEEKFGWSHELQSEPWHLRYFAGDQIPRAVLDFEAHRPTSDPEDDMPAYPYRLFKVTDGQDAKDGKVYAVGPNYFRWITEEEFYAAHGLLWDGNEIVEKNSRQRDVIRNDVLPGSGKR